MLQRLTYRSWSGALTADKTDVLGAAPPTIPAWECPEKCPWKTHNISSIYSMLCCLVLKIGSKNVRENG